jgi:hypothetical protein
MEAGGGRPRRRRAADDDFALPMDDGPRRGGSGGECTMILGSKPWAQVIIDGRDTHKSTPLSDYKLPCGRHRITFRSKDGYEKDFDVTLISGELFKRVYTLHDINE